MKKLFSIQPEQWSNLLNLLKPLNTQGSINIRGSGIYQDINSGVAILTADVKELIGEAIDFDIMNPQKHIKLFKLLDSTDKNVDLLEDDENEQFIATNGPIRVYLPKQIENINSEANKPDYDGLQQVGQTIKLDKKTKREIDTLIKSGDSQDSVSLLIKNDQIMGFEVPNTGIYLFSEYAAETGLNTEIAELVLKSLAFLIFDGETFEISLGMYPDGKYMLLTGISTGLTTMTLHEDLDVAGSGDELDLI